MEASLIPSMTTETPTLQLAVQHGPPPTIHAIGELNYTNCDKLAALIAQAHDGKGSVVQLDLRGLEFVDSSGLRILLTAARDAAEAGGKVHIVSLNRQFSHILEISGLGRLFDIAPDAYEDVPSAGVCVPGMPLHSFSIPCVSSACHEARAGVRHFAMGMGFDDLALDDITLAVGEAVSNAVRHGTPGSKSVDVECSGDRCKLKLVLRYQSATFDPDSLPIPNIETKPSGGMGVYFMRLVMDQVHYDFSDGYATVTLEKQVAEQSAVASI
jgi:serine/threonine-protein kinase RsbW